MYVGEGGAQHRTQWRYAPCCGMLCLTPPPLSLIPLDCAVHQEADPRRGVDHVRHPDQEDQHAHQPGTGQQERACVLERCEMLWPRKGWDLRRLVLPAHTLGTGMLTRNRLPLPSSTLPLPSSSLLLNPHLLCASAEDLQLAHCHENGPTALSHQQASTVVKAGQTWQRPLPHIPLTCWEFSMNRPPDGVKKAYVRLTADYDALDVANKIGVI
eukprot:365425-Chlamydomonas_euryale.AAC.11